MNSEGGAGKPVKRDKRQAPLFDIGPAKKIEPIVQRPGNPIWTTHKAQLIARYLYYFVQITKHGAYIDAFAGPQEETETPDWSARLVIESQPRWFTKFFLFDANPDQVARLKEMVSTSSQADSPKIRRKYTVTTGDVNKTLPEMLAQRPIKDKEATFALLDQRTVECHWSTVEALARYKPEGQHKIELFYFFMNHWYDRTIAATTRNKGKLSAWWGGDDWHILTGKKHLDRAMIVSERIKQKLGYASVKPWAICQKEKGGGSVMYYMIHATDHPEAPELMDRAYRRVLKPRETKQQLSFLQRMVEAEALSGRLDPDLLHSSEPE